MAKKDSDPLAFAVGEAARLFEELDGKYVEVAGEYGFSCRDCEQNCCGERFTHSTLVEQALIAAGLDTLEEERRSAVVRRAEDVAVLTRRVDLEGGEAMILCPLNVEGRCILYRYRPMICRLHGIPHTLDRGRGQEVKGGCHKFDKDSEEGAWRELDFDRLPFYRKMAAIEIELRKALGFNEKIRRTVAEMILHIDARPRPFRGGDP